MKRFSRLLPLFAIVTGVALVAVTSAFKVVPQNKSGDAMYQFIYTPPTQNDYSVSSVQDEGNWSYAPNETCPNGNVKACTIQASHVDDSDPNNPVLLSSEDITATANGSGVAHVTSTADAPSLPSSDIANKSN
ncbi:hypothetical protein [Arachidicoccus soli]|uniref:Uncharacterized protein n=1 Tax=Arachidicoccus soli TaxID=2341117 RepID=A0A386HPI1_9BACT|nr:hypothetical protein [Arachidicoccus soli]AYD47400.1 hypothetical protein D6B99_07125 [Arachidicoccus soli]